MVDVDERNKDLARVEKAFWRTGGQTGRYGSDMGSEQNRRVISGGNAEPGGELKFMLPDTWSVKLFLAVCQRLGIRVFRYPRQRQTTVMVRIHEREFRRTAWVEYTMLEEELGLCLEDVTDHLIECMAKGSGSDSDYG